MNIDNNMSGRVNVVLPDDIHELVKGLAESERRSQSQMAAILIEEALKARNLLKKETPSPTASKGE
jgi:predicted transcriptional regulator